jgi:SAM-dependent methyltransferase
MSTTTVPEVDLAKVEGFVGNLVGLMTGSAVSAAIGLGDRLGLYRAMNGSGPLTADALAKKTTCQPRLIREWLDSQAAAGLIAYSAATDTYEMSPEAALVLADEDSPAFLAGGTGMLETMYVDLPKMVTAFKGNGAIPWGEHFEALYSATARFFRPGYRTNLVANWIPAMTGVAEKLTAGGSVADVGCGFGHSCTVLAKAFPNAQVHGFDFHEPSVRAARDNAAQQGLSDRIVLDVAGATTFTGKFDLICFFDCLHDMGDPVAIARHAREQLKPDGKVLLVEPFALDGRESNISHNPGAALYYSASTFLCTPSSLSQPGARALGAQCGESAMRSVFSDAGYTGFRRAHESPFNIVYEAHA